MSDDRNKGVSLLRRSKYITPVESSYSKGADLMVRLFFLIVSLISFLPVLLVFIISFSSEKSILSQGYSFFPKEFTLESYKILFRSGSYLIRSLFNSVLITATGTLLGLIIMCPFAYALSRKEFKFRKAFVFFLMIPMLFSGGLVSTYMVNTQILHLKNSYWALILPGLCSTWYIMILRNYFKTTIPDSLIEASLLDGGRQHQVFFYVVLPLSKPVIATVAAFQTLNYWNSWYPSLLYIDSNHTELYPLQYVLVNMERSINTIIRDSQYLSAAQDYVPPAITVRMVLVVIVILPIMVVFPFFQKALKTGMTVGAIKE
ncbi:MAG: carbohydrate ABC transporter permease [Lachnospiraceae bacterium]|nr:carbohydrate ABC transporter permease [Lachnospiraceae bacterium]